MIRINASYKKLKASYLFSEIAQRVKTFQEAHPDADIIKMGIGDVTRPLPEACLKAFHEGVDELGSPSTFKGYGPEQGYPFLREAIAENIYNTRGISTITADDIFVSDGSKCDSGAIQEIFGADITIGITDPVYPVYVDSNVMAGRTGRSENGRYEGLIYLDCTSENSFTPLPPSHSLDLIYLCSPNNPTGTVLSRQVLQKWVEYAQQNKSLILFDAAYAAFIQDPSLPQSIFEIEGAEDVAIEFRSFSKDAGFTGVRCAYTVVSDKCRAFDEDGNSCAVKPLWSRRQATRFNGTSYPVQKAAAAVFSDEGAEQIEALIQYYLKNASLIKETFTGLGYKCEGGVDSPYIWIETGTDSWEFFDEMLRTYQIVCTPGAGFGSCGQGFARMSAFNDYERVVEAMSRLKAK